MSRNLKTLTQIERDARYIELRGPALDKPSYRLCLGRFTDKVNRYVGDESCKSFIDRINYVTHVVRADGRQHDATAPKALDLTDERCRNYVDSFGSNF